MKKILLNILVTAIAFGGTSVAYAQSVMTQGIKPREEIKTVRANATAEIKTIRENVASTTQEMKDRIKAEVKKQVGERYGRMIERLGATIAREESIMARINSRIEKVKTAGGKTDVAEKLMVTAKSELDVAKASLATITNGTETIVTLELNASSTGARNSLESLRKSAKNLEGHLRLAHNAMVKALGSLRGMSSTKPENQATSTKINTEN